MPSQSPAVGLLVLAEVKVTGLAAVPSVARPPSELLPTSIPELDIRKVAPPSTVITGL